jgi:hypothetical protein
LKTITKPISINIDVRGKDIGGYNAYDEPYYYFVVNSPLRIANSVLRLSNGADVIKVFCDEEQIDPGDANDLNFGTEGINITGTLDLGDGNNRVETNTVLSLLPVYFTENPDMSPLVRTSASLLAGSGNDYIRASSIITRYAGGFIRLNAGDDKLEIADRINVEVIDMGSGNDSIVAAEMSVLESSIILGEGNDSVLFFGKGGVAGNINADAGDDIVTASRVESIRMGEGNDKLTIDEIIGNYPDPESGVYMDGGDDFLTVSGGATWGRASRYKDPFNGNISYTINTNEDIVASGGDGIDKLLLPSGRYEIIELYSKTYIAFEDSWSKLNQIEGFEFIGNLDGSSLQSIRPGFIDIA